MNYDNLCISCFQKMDSETKCNLCGYAEGERKSTYLKARTLLSGRYLIGEVTESDNNSIRYKSLDTVKNAIVEVQEYFPRDISYRSADSDDILSSNEPKYRKYIEKLKVNAGKMKEFSDSENVINIFDCFDANNTFYIVMEYLEGMYLRDYIASSGGRLDEATALTIITSVLDGLSLIHKAGLVHRKISTRSIFISVDNKIKIIDFTFLKDASPYKESKMTTVFVPGYTAPEQYADVSKQGAFTDIYSAGAVLYRMLTGKKPVDALSRMAGDEPRNPSEIVPELSRDTELAIIKAMSMESELRFKSAADFKNTLMGQKGIYNIDRELDQIKDKKNKIVLATSAAIIILGIVAVLFLLFK